MRLVFIKIDEQPSDTPVCLCCGGQADPRTPDEPCHECKVENAERIAEGDR